MIEEYQKRNKQFAGSNFIQKFEFLGSIIKNKNDINALELILSFELSNQIFTATNPYIAHRISIKNSSVNEVLSRLEKAGFITRNDGVFNPKLQRKQRVIKTNTAFILAAYDTWHINNMVQLNEVSKGDTDNEKETTPADPSPNEVNEDVEINGDVAGTDLIEVKKTDSIKNEGYDGELSTEDKNAETTTNKAIESEKTSTKRKPKYKDFNVKNFIKYSLRQIKDVDENLIKTLDEGWLDFRLKNKIQLYDLGDFADYANQIDNYVINEALMNQLEQDLRLLGKIEFEKTAA